MGWSVDVPSYLAQNSSFEPNNVTTHTIALPDGSNVVGRKVVIFFTNDGDATPTLTGWTTPTNGTGTNAGADKFRLTIFERVIDGTEGFDGTGDTVAATTGASERSAHVSFLLGSGASLEVEAFVEQNTEEPDPPSHTPSGGEDDYGYFAVSATGARDNVVSGFPSGYSNGIFAESGSDGQSSEHATVAVAYKETTASSSDNPGIFTQTLTQPTLVTTISIAPSTESVSLFATATQTIADVVDELDTTVDLHLSVDDDPDTPNDADWINNAINISGGDASVFFDVTDLPGDFGNAETGEIEARFRGQNFGSGTINLYARLYRSDETTPLSDEVLVATVTGNTAFANASPVTITGINTSADKAVWDAARVRFRWSSA